MASCYVSVGSNLEPEKHICAALGAIGVRFGHMRLSPVYQTRAEGFQGPDFLNLVVGFEATEEPAEIAAILRRIEAQNGRLRGAEKYADRTLDLDLLLLDRRIGEFGRVSLPRNEIERYAFVLRPLADLIPDVEHPVVGQSYAEMWVTMAAAMTAEQHQGMQQVGLDCSATPYLP